MKNRKGFTITELVIVIAVIAILAAVLIPTFSNLISKANNSADFQEARNAYTEYLSVVNAQPADEVYVKGGDQYFKVTNGKISETATANPTSGVLVSMNGDDVVIDCQATLAAGVTTHNACTTCNGQHNAPAGNN